MVWKSSEPLVSQISSLMGRSSMMMVCEMNSGLVVGGRVLRKGESMNRLSMLDLPTSGYPSIL